MNLAFWPAADGALLLTDTLEVRSRSTLNVAWRFRAKVHLFAQMNAVAVVRGASIHLDLVGGAFSHCTDFDEAVDRFREILARRYRIDVWLNPLRRSVGSTYFKLDKALRPAQLAPTWDFELLLAGWSTRDGRVKIVTSALSDGFEPTLLEPGSFLFSPALSEDELAVAGIGDPVFSSHPLQVPRYLLRCMQAQRDIDAGKNLAIGGAAILTRIDQHGIHHRAYHQWDDRLGERINTDSRVPHTVPLSVQ